MKIYIKSEEGKGFNIHLPLWVLKLGCGNVSKYLIMHKVPEKHLKYIDAINFRELRRGIDTLKEYRGLKLVEIKSKDGSQVIITV